ncbi:hypothetical protein M9H77_11838 [Catharanthus roseus]|uniref:Uncharacterized protein n=1 Tax=Catharanthus roseus TaxID=4058 RepID=A0ACC0BFQ7_CATRO|nr:hypothetical protein M9H77_11838 [Catharanthus roseus]
MIDSVTLDLDPVDRGCSTVGGLGPKRYCVRLRIMLCGSGYFLEGWVRRGPPARVAQGGLAGNDYGMPEFVRRPLFKFRTLSVKPIMVHALPRGTQVPYSTAVDLAEGYGVSQVVSELEKMSRPGHRLIYQDETIVRGSPGSTPSSSYSLREIDPE